MARKKVNLAWIANDATRRATFKKRRKGLMKKVSELATLCDVKACAIVYGPQEAQPEVWPTVAEATKFLARFRAMPEMEQCKKMMNQEGFLRQRAQKLHEQLRKMERDNRELEMTVLMYEGMAGRSLHDLGIEDATSLAWTVEMKVKAVQERLENVKMEMAAAAAEVAVGPGAMVAMDVAAEALQRQNWLMEGMMSPIEPTIMFGGWEDVMHPFLDNGSLWNIDPLFPSFN